MSAAVPPTLALPRKGGGEASRAPSLSPSPLRAEDRGGGDARNAKKILLGAVAGAHGVRGEVRLKTFTADPKAIGKYGPVDDESGTRSFKVKVRGQVRGLVIAKIDGIDDRNAAEAVKGLRLYVGRDRLPKPRKGEWYHADLIGLRAERSDGTALGRVKSVANYGAGDILEVERDGGATVFLPFTKKVVPEVDVEAGRIVVEPPAEVEARSDERDEDDEK